MFCKYGGLWKVGCCPGPGKILGPWTHDPINRERQEIHQILSNVLCNKAIQDRGDAHPDHDHDHYDVMMSRIHDVMMS